MLIHWIWLSTRPSMNERHQKALLEIFGDAERIYLADEKALAAAEGISREGLLDKDLTQAQKILNDCVDKGIALCTFADENYPSKLRQIADPPMVLYYRGRLPKLDEEPVIGAVGTREATPYGLNVARRIGYQIAACGGTLISGAAKGIDGMAMQGALLAEGMVIGVLGCGADIVYPKCNRQLFEDVIRCGCLISEFPPKTPAYGGNFLKRNRIISGISSGVVVIEAPKGSGAMNTARHAQEQNRDVFVVPGNVDVPNFEGSNDLLFQGAAPVRNGWDILSQYAYLYPRKLHSFREEVPEELPLQVAQKTVSPVKNQKPAEKKDKKPIDKEQAPPYSDVRELLPKLPEHQRCIVELLTQPRLVDDIIAEMGLTAGKVAAALTLLEIRGVIRRLPGKYIALK